MGKTQQKNGMRQDTNSPPHSPLHAREVHTSKQLACCGVPEQTKQHWVGWTLSTTGVHGASVGNVISNKKRCNTNLISEAHFEDWGQVSHLLVLPKCFSEAMDRTTRANSCIWCCEDAANGENMEEATTKVKCVWKTKRRSRKKIAATRKCLM